MSPYSFKCSLCPSHKLLCDTRRQAPVSIQLDVSIHIQEYIVEAAHVPSAQPKRKWIHILLYFIYFNVTKQATVAVTL
jgi:hypothetical protein